MKRILVIIFWISFFNFKCITDKKNFITHPSISKKNITSLKLNGIYVDEYIHPILNIKVMNCYILYSNGVLLLSEQIKVNTDSINNTKWISKQVFESFAFQDSFYRRRQSGGFLLGTNHEIILQAFKYVPYGGNSLCTFKGNVLNDSTIYVSRCDIKGNPKYCKENFYLKFIEMNKPDSTNQLMKKSWYWQR